MKNIRPFWFFHNKISPLKKAVNYAFLTFIISGIYFTALSLFGGLDLAPFFGTAAFLSAALIAAPSFLFLRTWIEKIYNIYFIVALEAMVVFTLFLNALGTAGLYRLGVGYDSFVHFSNSAIYAVWLYLILYVWTEKYFLKTNKTAIFFAAIVLVFLIGLGWEWLEVVGDDFFGSKMTGDPYAVESWQSDTLKDIVYNSIGSLFGVILVALYGERWLKGLKNQRNWKKFIKIIQAANQKRKELKLKK